MQPRRPSRFGRVLAVILIGVFGVVPLIIPMGAEATAAPGDPPGPLSLRDIGSSSTLAFPGQQGAVSVSLPVPQNLAPTEIRGSAQLPAFVTGGNVDVMQGDRLISRNPIPTAPGAPITLSLRGVRVDRNAVDVVLRSYLRAEGFCQFDPDNTFRIVNASVTLSLIHI